MAKEKYGLALNPGPFGINSRPALVGAKYAEDQGVGPAYHQSIFDAYWKDGRNIAEEDVLQEIATSVGLNGEEFLTALQGETHRSAMQADVEQAHAYGLTGVPALIFENKYLAMGAQPLEVLASFVEKIERGEPLS